MKKPKPKASAKIPADYPSPSASIEYHLRFDLAGIVLRRILDPSYELDIHAACDVCTALGIRVNFQAVP